MPCRDDRTCDYQEERAEERRRLDLLTREMCALLEKDIYPGPLSQELSDWWKIHQIEDRARKKREAERAERDRKYNEERLAKLESEAADLKAKLGKK